MRRQRRCWELKICWQARNARSHEFGQWVSWIPRERCLPCRAMPCGMPLCCYARDRWGDPVVSSCFIPSQWWLGSSGLGEYWLLLTHLTLAAFLACWSYRCPSFIQLPFCFHWLFLFGTVCRMRLPFFPWLGWESLQEPPSFSRETEQEQCCFFIFL